ncbi:MAG: TolC family protein, partial [Elusimicrobia bacterium]|nr:TolC family protein [Elusimicrobiota bacterium]
MARAALSLLLTAALGAAPALRAAEPASPVETYTLEEAQRKAELNSAEVLISQHGIIIAEQRVAEAEIQFLPEVGLQALGTRYNAHYPFALRPEFRNILLYPSARDNVFSGQGYVTVPLYEGGRNLNTLRLAQTALKQARAKLDTAKLDVKAATAKAYYGLLLAQDKLAATKKVLDALDAAPSRPAGALETLEAEAAASDLRSTAAQEQRDLDTARLDFLKVLNRELDTPVQVEGTLTSTPADVDLRRALLWAAELRPELQAQTYRAAMDAIGVSLALQRRNPSVLLGLDYELTGQTFPLKQNNWDATVGVRLPFTLDLWAQHTEKLSEQRQSEVRRSELRDQVYLEVREAYNDLMHWQQEWPRREKEVQRLEELLRKADLAPGSASWLKAESLVLAARKQVLEAVAAHAVARARLERAVGRALPTG